MKKAFIIIICIMLALGMTGCWNARELKDYAFVLGVGIDKAKDTGNILMTAQIALPGALKRASDSGGNGSGDKAYYNIKNEGETIFKTVRGFTHEASRKLYWQHNKIIILSREIAEEGVQKYIDFFVRDHETRIVTYILVASKDKASDILDAEPKLEKIPSVNINNLAETQQYTSEAYCPKLSPFLQRLMSKTTAPVAPLIEIFDEGAEKNVRISGTAVFKKGKLAGELNKPESRGLLWVVGEVKSGIIVVDCPGGEGKADLEIVQASSTIIPEIKDGRIRMKVEIKEKGNLGTQSCPENLATTDMLKILENKQASVIRDEIAASIKKAQELNADIFGFGEAVYRKYPGQWKDLENRWDEIFPDLDVEISVDAQLYGTGKITKPAAPEKE